MNFKENMDEIGKEWDDIWVEGRNDFKAICKEGTEDLREFIEEKASNINYNFGEAVVNFNSGMDTVEDVVETAGNAFWAVTKKVVAPHEIFRANEVDRPILYPGDHIYVDYVVFTHHGLYCDYGQVIHYAPIDDSSSHIHKCTIDEFANNRRIFVCSKDESPIRFKTEKVIERANSRLGEVTYNLLINNCENFVRWCRFGRDL